MISAEKQSLRLRMAETLRALGEESREEKSSLIAAQLKCLSGVVFGFAPMRLEPDWTGAIGAGWDVALPRTEAGGLAFHRVTDFSTLAKGRLGAREPAGGEVIAPSAANVILVPGVAFDRDGARLGRGGGYYDRLLASVPASARRIGVCFACQIVERVPVEPHDVALDEIVTEDGWVAVRSSGRGRD